MDLKLSWNDYQLMWSRINNFQRNNGRPPNYVDINDYRVTKEAYLDAATRVREFVSINHRNPYNVTVTATPITPNEWTLTPGYTYDQQDTGYTCGPTSMSMLLSELGIHKTEQELAQLMHTTTSGTGHQGFFDAMKSLGLKCYHDTIDNITWKKLEEITASPNAGAIFHTQISNDGTAYDSDDKLVWSKYRGGHYIYLIGINNPRDLLKVADPTKGEITYRFGQLQIATKLTLSKLKVPGVIVVSR